MSKLGNLVPPVVGMTPQEFKAFYREAFGVEPAPELVRFYTLPKQLERKTKKEKNETEQVSLL